MKGFPRRGSDRILRQGNQNPQIRLNEGLPQKGKRSLALAEQAYWRTGASMKGFPRRGSDGRCGGGRPAPGSGLNEGLPQKGKRS